ncbi:MAG: HTH domain-containing protein [Candidatus Falkowbacteria bacterium]
MKQPKFNAEQITALLENKHVTKCSTKAITYAKAFKVLAVQQYAEGMTATQIFRAAGLPPELVGEHTAKSQLKIWRNTFRLCGEAGLLTEMRGQATGSRRGRPKTSDMTDADRIKRLEIEVAYLKAKNDFLVKLRAQRKS